MILAAGKGTRLLPLSENIPKALVPFHGVPMLELLIKRLIQAGFTSIVINVHHLFEQIIDFVAKNNAFNIDIQFSIEDELLDTGGGIKKAAPLLGDKAVLFHNVDILSDISLKDFIAFHDEHEYPVSLAVKDRPTSRSLLFNHQGFLGGWEYPERNLRIISRNSRGGYTRQAFSGVYIIDPSLFTQFPDSASFSIIPWILDLSGKTSVPGYDHSSDQWYDLGSVENIEKTSNDVDLLPDGSPLKILKA